MKPPSLLKFSRYFFLLFLTGTLAPLLALLVWNDFQLKQFHQERHKQFLDMMSRDLHDQIDHYRARNRSALERLVYAVKKSPLTLEQYQNLLGTLQVEWLEPGNNAIFQSLRCGASIQRRFDNRHVVNDYCIDVKRLVLVSILPTTDGHQGLVAVKPVPLDVFVPPGPHHIELFAGVSPSPSSRLAVVDPEPPFKRIQNRLHRPPDGHPPLHFPGLAPNFDESHPPPLSPIAKTIPIRNQNGRVIATIRMQMREMPHPEQAERPWIGLLILCTGLLSSLAAGRYIYLNFIIPLTRLSVLTTCVQKGDLSGRADTRNVRQAEVRRTLQGFNAMLEQMEEKERLRNHFISNLTHDFRTPLIAQARALELLIRDFEGQPLHETQARLARSLLHNNEHLLEMVNQLLETYQFEGGQLKLCRDWVSLPQLVENAFEALKPLADSRQIRLEKSFPMDFPTVSGDSACLNRVFINLIANAIENIPKGSHIQVYGDCPDVNHVVIHVRDNGLGIPSDEQKHLFERYYSGLSDTRKLGSGLGLYICKMFIEAHQGWIQVESRPGVYTDFSVRLPVREESGTGGERNIA